MSACEILRANAIDIAVEPHDWAYARVSRDAIDTQWRAISAGNASLYDGRVLLLHRQNISGGCFSGGCFETAFSAFHTWRKQGFPDLTVRNFFGMAALRAQDGAFLLGEMAGATASAGQVYFPAGTPDPGDIRNGKVDLLASVMRELEEETGLRAEEVVDLPGWDVVSCGGYLAFMRALRVSGSGEAAAARIEAALAAQARPELSRIHVIREPGAAAGLNMPPFMLPYLVHAFRQDSQSAT